MESLAAYDRTSLATDLTAWGESPVWASRILRHYWRSFGSPTWDGLQMTATLRARLDALSAQPPLAHVARERVSSDGTVKLLLDLAQGGQVEAVMMPSLRDGEAAACVSSQVGCAVGCDFCASTRLGLTRNLHHAEITTQFLFLEALAHARGRKIRRLVFMGMGEPLHNLQNVGAAVARIADLGRLGSARITISTVGTPLRGLRTLAEAQLGVQLAVSLHAADDATRHRLIPGAKNTTIAELLQAVRDFERTSKHVVNIEYCLLAGINDADHHADALAALLAGWRVHVNLIAYNATAPGRLGVVYQRPAPEVIDGFVARLRGQGVVTHVRYSRGEDVDAACGQLRLHAAEEAAKIL